jgi:transposase/quinol monooxygenase YgiN
MILRILRARLRPGMRDAFTQLCQESSIPLMRAAPGLVTLHIGKPLQQRPDEFVLISVWRDLASLQAFVGARWEEIMIVPGEAELIESASVSHYDEMFQHISGPQTILADSLASFEQQVQEGVSLTDAQWAHIRPLLPPARREGRPRANERRTLEGILYQLRTGCRWQDIPAEYGSGVTCWRRLTQWETDGTWDRIWPVLLSTLDATGRLAWARAFLQGTIVPVRRASSTGGSQNSRNTEVSLPVAPARQSS